MSKIRQRLAGVLLLIVGAAFTAVSWREALELHHYARWSAVAFPMLSVFGLMLLFAPFDRELLQARHGVDSPTKMEHYTTLQKVIVYAGVALAVANYVGLRGAAGGWL